MYGVVPRNMSQTANNHKIAEPFTVSFKYHVLDEQQIIIIAEYAQSPSNTICYHLVWCQVTFHRQPVIIIMNHVASFQYLMLLSDVVLRNVINSTSILSLNYEQFPSTTLHCCLVWS